MVDRLEQGVIKLEAENIALKEQVIVQPQPVSSINKVKERGRGGRD